VSSGVANGFSVGVDEGVEAGVPDAEDHAGGADDGDDVVAGAGLAVGVQAATGRVTTIVFSTARVKSASDVLPKVCGHVTLRPPACFAGNLSGCRHPRGTFVRCLVSPD
jgi:hypothetical protein